MLCSLTRVALGALICASGAFAFSLSITKSQASLTDLVLTNKMSITITPASHYTFLTGEGDTLVVDEDLPSGVHVVLDSTDGNPSIQSNLITADLTVTVTLSNFTTCYGGLTFYAKFGYHYDDVVTPADSYNDRDYVVVTALSTDLCGVTTGRPTPFNTTAYVSPHEDFHVISPFVWLDNMVFVAVEYNLPWAKKAPTHVVMTKLYLSGPAVNTSAWDGVIYTDVSQANATWNVTSGCPTGFQTTASAVAKNSILCFKFKLLPGYFIRDHYLRITAGTQVTSMPSDDRRSVATESVALETSAIVNVIGAMDTAAEAAERLAIAAPEQKQTVRYEYQYRSVPAVAAAAAFVATALVASAAFFAVRASRAARAASL